MKSGAQPGGRLPASTAKPWFCAVMKQRRVSSCRHGWLCPRFPYLGQQDGRQAAPGSRDPAVTQTPYPHSLHLVRAGTEGQGEQLVPQADPKDGFGLGCVQHPSQVGHCLLAELRVPRAIADEQPIKVCVKAAAGSERGLPAPKSHSGAPRSPQGPPRGTAGPPSYQQ